MKNNNEITKTKIAWNYIGTVFNMGINFFILPFLLYFLSDDELGLWYVMQSIMNFGNLFTFGFTTSFSRNIAYCWNGAEHLCKEGKSEKASANGNVNHKMMGKMLVTSQVIFFVLASSSLLAISTIGTVYFSYVSRGMIDYRLKISWVILLIGVFLNVYFAYYESFLVGIGCIKEKNEAVVIACVVRIFLTGILMAFGLGIMGAVVGYVCYGFLYRSICKHYFMRIEDIKLSYESNKKERLSVKEIKESFTIVWGNAWKDGVVSISDYLSTQFGTIICSAMLSLSDAAMYSLITQIVTAIGKIARSIYSAHTPLFERSFIIGDTETARTKQAFCIFIYTALFVCGSVVLCLVGYPVLCVLRPSMSFNQGFILCCCVYHFLLNYRACFGVYLSYTNRLTYWKSYILTAIGTIIAYYILLCVFQSNVWIIVVISILGELVYNFWKWPCMVNRELDLSFKSSIIIGWGEAKKMVYKEKYREG